MKKTLSWDPLTPDEVARLEALGLDEPTFLFFRETFVGHPFDYNADSGFGWRRVDRRHLSNSDLIAHLEGKVSIATGVSRPAKGAEMTLYFVIDLDAGADLDARYDRLVALLGYPALLFRTPGGGYHAYWFLSEPVPVARLTA